MSAGRPVLLLTGAPGIGKTTVIRRVVERLDPSWVGGFFTREIRLDGRRAGFQVVTTGGAKGHLATLDPRVTFNNEVGFGRYRVNLDAIDRVAVPAIQEAARSGRVVLVDEIGPMELLSPAFRNAILDLLASDTLFVLGTIVSRPHDFADDVKAHPRVLLRHVTLGNRAVLPGEIDALVRRYGSDNP